MNYDYDVAVIGLGPVGSFAALLLEKKRFESFSYR